VDAEIRVAVVGRRREVVRDRLLEPGPDVLVERVAARVDAALGAHLRLPRALGDDDERVLVLPQLPLDVVEDRRHVELRLGNEAEVDVAGRQRRVHGDEAAVAAHELDDADAVRARRGLGRRGDDVGHGGLDGRREPKGLVDDRHVVVDGLRHDRDGALEAAARHLRVDLARACARGRKGSRARPGGGSTSGFAARDSGKKSV